MIAAQKPRMLPTLTGVRGFAALAVLFYHIRGGMAGYLPGAVIDGFAHGYLAVDLFFVLSGFVLWWNYGPAFVAEGTRAAPRFLARRIARIFPLHLAILAAMALFALALLASGRDPGPHYGFAALPAHALLVQNWGFTADLRWNDPAWSISTEWAAYLLLAATGGWAARFVLSGIETRVFDPNPETPRIVGEVLDNARRAWAQIAAVQLPAPGALVFCASAAEACDGAHYVQESVPERMELKTRVIADIEKAAAEDALIGSSTSGLLPSRLQAEMAHPQRFLVAHPYNPVYLLPLVEIVGGEKTDPAAIERAKPFHDSIGMKGVTIAREIDAFVGDRLLEAMWREALWLVRDGVCDVETLDDVIRYSFGLRFAQMGIFQTYRIAGGEAGMRHFLAQFGPALKWPWTRLTDVPELDEELIGRIAGQSDAQAKGLDVRELERIRDDNLVAILKALAATRDGEGWGAGALLNDFAGRRGD